MVTNPRWGWTVYRDSLKRRSTRTESNVRFTLKVYLFSEDLVKNLISSSIRQALENPLNYARSYLADILEPCVNRVIYLDSDLVVVDDIKKLWSISLTGSRTIGAGRKLCYFNTGVMVMDLVRWREGNFRRRIEYWMEFQKQRRIYELGSLPPFLLVFAGDVVGEESLWKCGCRVCRAWLKTL
ncbi:hypothetical protein HHK36_007113 [Tetracentron sinense]|uniref:Hexosyltransferase n=1 Tax=Tetracentron sinense TaxID=13715 RepID=A0A835DKY0_TETSI|nr:hypothetical protein HHK36_007113 [Tetracentron sinense]